MPNEITIRPGELSILDNLPAEFKAEHDETLEHARALTVCASDYDARKIGAVLKTVKALKKTVNAERMAITRRLDGWKKQIMQREKDICALLDAEETRLSGIATEYATAKAEAERAAEEKAREEREAEAMLTGVAPDADDDRSGPLIAGVRSRTVIAFEISDADAVPRAYCSPDEKLVREYIQAVKAADPNWTVESFRIPGIIFRKEVRV